MCVMYDIGRAIVAMLVVADPAFLVTMTCVVNVPGVLYC